MSPSAAALIGEGAAILAAAGIESPRFEARLLLETASGLRREELVAAPERVMAPAVVQAYRDLLARRAAREPMAYILGSAPFWSFRFAVGPGVLVPRPETETLIEAALEAFPGKARPLRLLDLGTGSGCLVVTLLHLYPDAIGIGVDPSEAARRLAALNAARTGVADRLLLVAGSWTAALGGPFDLVVSNPPYIRAGEIGTLQPEVQRFEPHEALDGGPDGLAAYRAIVPDLPRILAPGGLALLEIGQGQEGAVTALAAAAGLEVLQRQDLAGIVRCLELRRPSGRL